MSEPTTELKTAFDAIDTRWDEPRTERTLDGAHAKLARRKKQRIVATSIACAVTLAVSAWAFAAHEAELARGSSRSAPAAANGVQTSNTATQRMQLADGSEVSLLDRDTRVVVREVSAIRTELELSQGHARFDIVHRADRVFRVASGEVTVEVLGTAFELERSGARTRVAVERGRVAVRWGGAQSELAAGEAGWFPKALGVQKPLDGSAASNAAPEDRSIHESDAPEAASSKHALQKVHAAASESAPWREPAEHGNFAEAYALLSQGKHSPADDVEELMLAADTARLSGHPDAAVPFLTRVVDDHARDSRAPLAAFTLGGVLMRELGRPRDAEAAYAKARALALNSSLAQDALARQVEAAHRAGDAALARSLAREYLARYPNGRRVHAVRRFSGLDTE